MVLHNRLCERAPQAQPRLRRELKLEEEMVSLTVRQQIGLLLPRSHSPAVNQRAECEGLRRCENYRCFLLPSRRRRRINKQHLTNLNRFNEFIPTVLESLCGG